MLGTIESTSSWHWAAYGKHPVANDYFRVGGDLPLVQRFSDWVENGYRKLSSQKNVFSNLYSWRFWARGSQKESIACGVLRDSSDRMGRPYPLLIMGTGLLNGWEDHWDLMPFACEASWNQIEYLSAFVVNDLKKFEQEVYRIRPPYPGWPDFEMNRKDLKEIEKQVSFSSDQAELILDLEMHSNHDQMTQANLYHTLIRRQIIASPNAIFMGGTLDRTCLAVFRRPLQTSDFIQLWSVSTKDRIEQ